MLVAGERVGEPLEGGGALRPGQILDGTAVGKAQLRHGRVVLHHTVEQAVEGLAAMVCVFGSAGVSLCVIALKDAPSNGSLQCSHRRTRPRVCKHNRAQPSTTEHTSALARTYTRCMVLRYYGATVPWGHGGYTRLRLLHLAADDGGGGLH